MKYGFQVVWKWVWTTSSVGNLAGSYFLAGSSSSSQANYWVRDFQILEKTNLELTSVRASLGTGSTFNF
jgi:hypothetical protein